MKHLNTKEKTWGKLVAGSLVELEGDLVTARDGTLRQLQASNQLEVLSNQVIYFCGPTPAGENRIIGSCGPTTSSRMEPYFEDLIGVGVRAIIGKGQLSQIASEQLQAADIPYFSALGGAGALYSECVTAAKVIALPELGPEAVYRLTVEDFPIVVQ